MRIDRVKLITELAKRSMTLKKLSQASGVCYSTLSGIKHGRDCKTVTGQMIADTLGIDINELLESEG
jgi:lambda repressor-like predicted transcriptional regulator